MRILLGVECLTCAAERIEHMLKESPPFYGLPSILKQKSAIPGQGLTASRGNLTTTQ